jgi:predicted metal-dependent phosphoesterase TrpH
LEQKISCFWKEPKAAEAYQTAIALHGHTNFSQESLHFISDFAKKFAFLRWLMALKDREALRESKVHIDLKRAYWTPPLSPSAAFELETRQISEELRLRSFVSLTDHDNIHAALLLRVHKNMADVPISIEWSVPYCSAELHIGLHNLPPGSAEQMVEKMHAYTDNPSESVLKEVLAELHARRDVLIVLNHPVWDIVGAGEEVHRQAVGSFMAKFSNYVDAFELGGFRSWEENREVYELAAGWNVPIVAGGDRHGCEPSACLNLTNATSLPEYIDEVRNQKRTHVLFMPQYARPLWVRMLQVALDATQVQPGNPLGIYWDERTFHPDYTGTMRPISQLWVRRPAFIEMIFGTVRMLESAAIRQAIASEVRRRQQMQFLFGQEEA